MKTPDEKRKEILKDLKELEKTLLDALVYTNRMAHVYSLVYNYSKEDREKVVCDVYSDFHYTIENIGDIFYGMTEKVRKNS